MASSETFHFDAFTLDVRERRLLRGEDVVRLAPKAYDGGAVRVSLHRCGQV